MAEIMFPAGRMIGGDVDKLFPVTEDDGKTPKLDKSGAAMVECSIGYAIPKGPEQAWWETPWGAIIYQTGAAAHPNLVASPAFSWKITDGDSQIPNKKGKKPCEKVGHPGHWVLWFKQGWLPKKVNADGTVQLPDGAIVPGFYVQVYGSVAGNKLVTNGTPGVYLNPIAVALVGEGDRIASDVDTTSVGFGQGALPAGARPVSPVVPGMPTPGAMPPVPGAAAPLTPPMPPQAPVVPAGPVMLPAAQGQTYAAMIAAGWTDTTLIQHHMMQAPAAAPPTPPAAPATPPMPPTPPVGAPPTAPNMGVLTPPTPPMPGVAPGGVTPPAPPTPPAPAAPAGPVMLPKAGGVPYATFIAGGWTDAQLREQGYMQ